MVCLNTLLQLASGPLIRTLNECAPSDNADTSIPSRNRFSSASSKLQSVTKRGVPFPVPGSVSQKYSPCVTLVVRVITVSGPRSEEHTSELQSQFHPVCR